MYLVTPLCPFPLKKGLKPWTLTNILNHPMWKGNFISYQQNWIVLRDKQRNEIQSCCFSAQSTVALHCFGSLGEYGIAWLCSCPEISNKCRCLSYRWMLLKSMGSAYIFTTLPSFCCINTLVFFFHSLNNLSAVGPNFKGTYYQATVHQTTEHFKRPLFQVLFS